MPLNLPLIMASSFPMKISLTNRYKELIISQASVMGFTGYVGYQNKVDDFVVCFCSHYIMASIVMSFNIMPEYCFVKGFKTKEKSILKQNLIK